MILAPRFALAFIWRQSVHFGHFSDAIYLHADHAMPTFISTISNFDDGKKSDAMRDRAGLCAGKVSNCNQFGNCRAICLIYSFECRMS